MVQAQPIPGINNIYGKIDVRSTQIIRFNHMESNLIQRQVQIQLMGSVQLCRILKGGKRIPPTEYWQYPYTGEHLKIATTNANCFFIDVLQNTKLALYQSSWLAIREPIRFPLTDAEYRENLLERNNEAKEAYDINDEAENFIATNYSSILLSDAHESSEGVTYEFRTYAAAIATDGNYQFYEGLYWSYDKGVRRYHSLLRNPENDVELQNCMAKFNNIDFER